MHDEQIGFSGLQLAFPASDIKWLQDLKRHEDEVDTFRVGGWGQNREGWRSRGSDRASERAIGRLDENNGGCYMVESTF